MEFLINLFEEIKKLQFIKKIALIYVASLPLMQIANFPLVKQKIQLPEVIFCILFICFLSKAVRNKTKFNLDFFVKLSLFLLLTFIPSFINAESKFFNLVEFLGFFYLLAMFLLIAQLMDNEKFWIIVLKVWLLVSLIVVFTGLIGYLFYLIGKQPNPFVAHFKDLQNVDEVFSFRVKSFFRHPNMLASYLHVAIIFNYIYLVLGKGNKKKLVSFFLLLIIFLITVLLCKSRIIAGILLSSFLCFVPLKAWYFRILKYLFFIGAISSIIFVGLISTWWIFPIQFNFDSQNHTASLTFNTISHTYLVRNKASLKIIKAHPFFGVGMGGYNKASINYTDWDEAKLSYKVLDPKFKTPQEKLVDPHSTILGWTAETGISGFVGIISFFAGFLVVLRNKILTSSYHTKRSVIWFFVAGFLGFFINSFYIDILTMRHFWFMNTMAIAYISIKGKLDIPVRDEKNSIHF